MATMTVTAKAIHDDATATIEIPEPQTFDDPQWAAWNLDEAAMCGKIMRQLRVDWANGGLREEIGKAYARGLRGDDLTTVAVEWLSAWKAGEQRGGGKVMDARGLNLTKAQVKHFEKQGFTVLTD